MMADPPRLAPVTDATGRAQDQGRRHRRKGKPTAETTSLLAEYQQAMRDELRAVLDELRGPLPDPGLGLVAPQRERPSLTERMRLWDLGIKIGRELGTEVDARPIEDQGATLPARPRRRARVDYG